MHKKMLFILTLSTALLAVALLVLKLNIKAISQETAYVKDEMMFLGYADANLSGLIDAEKISAAPSAAQTDSIVKLLRNAIFQHSKPSESATNAATVTLTVETGSIYTLSVHDDILHVRVDDAEKTVDAYYRTNALPELEKLFTAVNTD